MVKKILIMTVYGPSDYNCYWYGLQKHFISKNTNVPYDFKVVTNKVDSELFDDNSIVISNPENIGHPAAIKQIINYMRASNEYENYMLIDSDCFPVRAGWHNILTKQMLQLDKDIAAPVRFENLDLFPHPCAVYMNERGLNNPKLNFDYAKVRNLMGDEIDEVGGNMLQIINSVMPLTRTNRVNLHHVAAGIYHHLFYHHGAGSRGFQFRVQHDYQYYNHLIDEKDEIQYGDKLMSSLINDPEGFIDKLMYGF